MIVIMVMVMIIIMIIIMIRIMILFRLRYGSKTLRIGIASLYVMITLFLKKLLFRKKYSIQKIHDLCEYFKKFYCEKYGLSKL